jgi:hypothetical protein
MKKLILIISILLFVCTNIVLAQKIKLVDKKEKHTTIKAQTAVEGKMSVKDDADNVLIEVNDEGTKGSITFSEFGVGQAPSSTSSKLYNVNGTLYWSGSALGLSGSAAGWTEGGTNVYLTTGTDKVGIGTTSPEFKLSLDSDGGIIAKGTYNAGATISTSGEGTRLIWYPRKAAFRAGFVEASQWDENNIGSYSVAMGYNTTASNTYSTAMGYQTTASGHASTSMGTTSTASGSFSMSTGSSTTASGTTSMAMGQGTTASGNFSTTMGYNTTASSSYSMAMGLATTASGNNSMAMGHVTKAEAYLSTVIGRYNIGGGTAGSWIPTDPLFEIGIGTDDSENKANAMTVRKDGNVGIGVTSPDEKLEVDGKIKTTQLQITTSPSAGHVLTADASGNATWQAAPSGSGDFSNGGEAGGADRTLGNTDNYDVGLKTNNQTRLHIQNDGKVGIGTTNPTYKLHVEAQSSGALRVISFGGEGIRGSSDTGTGIIANSDEATALIAETPGLTAHLCDVTTNRAGWFSGNVIIQGSGRLGIGIANPTSQLHVEAQSSGALYAESSSGEGIRGKSVTGTGITALSDQAIALTAESPGLTAHLCDFTTNRAGWFSGNVIIQGSGRLGIGTANPTSRLDVYDGTLSVTHIAESADEDAIKIGVDGEYGASIKMYDDDDESTQHFKLTFNASTQDLRFHSDQKDNILYLTQGGYVGIGTDNPGSKFELNGAGSDAIMHIDVGAENVNSSGIRFKENGSDRWMFLYRNWQNNNFHIYDDVTNSEVMTFESNTGCIGIGNTNPEYLLHMESSGGGYYSASDHQWHNGSTRKIKQDIAPNKMDVLDIIDEVEVVNYRYKTEVKENADAPYHIGFIAEDTPKLLSGKNRDSMAIGDCVGLLLAVVKEQQKKISELEERIKNLER